MSTNQNSRRSFLRGAGVTAAIGLLGGLSSKSIAAGRQLPAIGIQLYTLRNIMAQNAESTLAKLAAMGYREVEFAGYYKHSPQVIKAMLQGAGLSAPSTHVSLTQIQSGLEKTLDTAAEIGHQYVVLAYLAPGQRKTLDQYKSYVDLFSHVGEAAKERGLQFGYHNHDFEFSALEGVIPYDYMLDNIDADLMKMTMDLYWIHRAGADPLRYFENHRGRFKQCHVKDMSVDGKMTDVGNGVIDFGRIFARSEQAGFEHYYVEHDSPADALISAKISIEYLQQLQF